MNEILISIIAAIASAGVIGLIGLVGFKQVVSSEFGWLKSTLTALADNVGYAHKRIDDQATLITTIALNRHHDQEGHV